MIHDYGSEKARSYTKRLPLYFGILLLTLIPFRETEWPVFKPDQYSVSQFLDAKASPKIGKFMIYLSDQGNLFFGRVERIEHTNDSFLVVWLRYEDTGIWCRYSTGLWIDFNQLLSGTK